MVVPKPKYFPTPPAIETKRFSSQYRRPICLDAHRGGECLSSLHGAGCSISLLILLVSGKYLNNSTVGLAIRLCANTRRRSAIEAASIRSAAPHVMSSIPHPNTDFCYTRIAS